MKHYSDGIYSKKQFLFFIFSIIFLIILASVVGSIVAIYTSFNIFIDLLITFLVVMVGMIVFMFVQTKFKTPTSLYKDFMLTNDIDALLKGYDELLEEKLSPDTRTYVKTLKAFYMFAVNEKEAFKLFENIEAPKNKAFLKDYRVVELTYYLNKEDAINFNNKISYFEINYPKSREIEPFKLLGKVILTTDEIAHIEQIFSVDTPYDFQNLDNCNTLCIYYDKRNNSSKVLYYANKMLKLAPINSQYYLLAMKMIDKYSE